MVLAYSKGGVFIRINLRVVSLTLVVLLASVVAVSACTNIVTVDIKPGSCPNSINVNNNGVLPIAISGDIRGVDYFEIRLMKNNSGYMNLARGPTDINICQVRVKSGNVVLEPCNLCSSNNFEGPGTLLKFRTQDIFAGITCSKYAYCFDNDKTYLVIRGFDKDGNEVFRGMDSVRLLNPGNKNLDSNKKK